MMIAVIGVAGCGSSAPTVVTQTVIERTVTKAATAPPATATSTVPTSTVSASRPKPSSLHEIPDLAGKRLDVAEEDAREEDVPFKVLGGGVFGVVVPSNWTVCEQEPSPGARAARVKLIVAREC
jgi:hypothetical protein